MKVLITEEQLKLIINESEYTGISATDIRNLIKTYENGPFTLCKNFNKSGCMAFGGFPKRGKYDNDLYVYRKNYIYPCKGVEVGDYVVVRTMNHGQKTLGWQTNKGEVLRSLFTPSISKDIKQIMNGENPKGFLQSKKRFSKNGKIAKNIKKLNDIGFELVKVTPENKHLLIGKDGKCDHPYGDDSYVRTDVDAVLQDIQKHSGPLSINSAYRDVFHQSITGSAGDVGDSNHQRGLSVDISHIGQLKSPLNPLNSPEAKSNSDRDKSWLFMVYLGPIWEFCAYGMAKGYKDAVHFTLKGPGFGGRDCKSSGAPEYRKPVDLVKKLGKDGYLSKLCNPNGLERNDSAFEINEAIWDSNKPGFSKIKEYCVKWNGGEIEPSFYTRDQTEESVIDDVVDEATRSIPLGGVNINGNTLSVNMGEVKSQVGFRLYRKIGKHPEEIAFKKTDGGVSTGGQTKKSFGKGETITFSLPNLMADSEIKKLPWTYKLFMKVHRVFDNVAVITEALTTEDFIIDNETYPNTCPQCKILTGEEIDKYYREHYNEDPQSLEDYIEIEQKRINQDIDNTYVKPYTIDFPKLDFDVD